MNNIKTKTLFEQEPMETKTLFEQESLEVETLEAKEMARKHINTKCIAKLYIKFPNGSTRQGTGFLYGTNVLATAGHCIYDPRYGGKAKSIRVVFPNGTQYTASRSRLYAPDEWLASTTSNMSHNWMYDYGVIKLSATPGRTLGYLDYQIISNSKLHSYVNNETPIIVSGYPEYYTTLQSSTGKIKKYSSLDIYFTASFVAGQSGGPVIVKTTGYFIGIANYGEGSTQKYPSGARITNAVADFLDLYY